MSVRDDAIGCAPLWKPDRFIRSKTERTQRYPAFFQYSDDEFVNEPAYATSNYWLNAIVCPLAQPWQQVCDDHRYDVMQRLASDAAA